MMICYDDLPDDGPVVKLPKSNKYEGINEFDDCAELPNGESGGTNESPDPPVSSVGSNAIYKKLDNFNLGM